MSWIGDGRLGWNESDQRVWCRRNVDIEGFVGGWWVE